MRITRKLQKILGLNTLSGQFGSARAGTFVSTQDPDVIQALPAWEQGWGSATNTGRNLPTLEERGGVDNVTTRQIAYIFQEGLPEYNAETEYFNTSLVKESGTVRIYKSLIDENIGNPLSDTLSWRFVCDFETVQPQNNYTATVDPTVNDDETLGYSSGSYWYNAVSTDTFFCVSAATGAAIWVLQSSIDPSDLGALAFENNATGVPASDPNGTGQTNVQGQLNLLNSGFNAMPIGVPFPVRIDLGVPAPSNAGTRKFIELTYGKSGSGGYNEGLLTAEATSGTFPNNLVATAQIVGGVMNGQTIRLLNTMQLFTRGAVTGGTLQRDAIRDITATIANPDTSINIGRVTGAFTRTGGGAPAIGLASTTSLNGTLNFNASNVVPTGPENVVQNEGWQYFMRTQ